MQFEQFLERRVTKKRKSKAPENHPRLFEGNFREAPRGIGAIAGSMLKDTGWRPPATFPDLRDSRIVSIDVESHDPRLRAEGPGFIRGDAHVVGVAVAAVSRSGETFKGYYPTKHLEGTEFNLPEDRVYSWLRDNVKSDAIKTGANLLYEMEALYKAGGVRFSGPMMDVQNAEGILDEESALIQEESHRGFSLEKLGMKYFGRGKVESGLHKIRETLGIKDVKGRLREFSPVVGVGEYGEGDVTLPIEILEKQLKEIERQGLGSTWRLECDLMYPLFEMRMRGVRVDLERATIVSAELKKELDAALDALKEAAGQRVDPWDRDHLKALCDKLQITCMMTAANNPSFTAPWLKEQKHPLLDMVINCRKIEKMRRDFVEGVILGRNIDGRLHTQFHQLRNAGQNDDSDEDDAEGTRSGRFSSTNPNLQQVPKRDDRFGPLIRSLFIPDEGHFWFCGDYNSQEFRLLAHYAALTARRGMLSEKGAKAALDLRERYIQFPETDYHQTVADMTGLDRATGKPLNLMLVYGAGQKKVALSAKWITQEQYSDKNFKLPPHVDKIFTTYHGNLPFVNELLELCENLAERRGYVSTIGDRRRHFELYIPMKWRALSKAERKGLPLALARLRWPDEGLRRADTRKALNAVIQGSAADMTKRAIVLLWNAGFCPSLTVHDEIDASVKTGADVRLLHESMRDAYQLEVPVLVDLGIGLNWAEANKDSKKMVAAKAMMEVA